MKVKIPLGKIIKMWIIVFLVVGAVLTLSLFNLFFLQEWGVVQPIIITLFLISMILVFILSINTYYYEINKKDLTECKFGKKFVYFYSDIVYIDEEESKRTKTLCFVTKYGHVKYLTFDKEGKIFEAVMNKCNNLISLEEVRAKFPGIKI